MSVYKGRNDLLTQPFSLNVWLKKCGEEQRKELEFNLGGFAKVLLKMVMEKQNEKPIN